MIERNTLMDYEIAGVCGMYMHERNDIAHQSMCARFYWDLAPMPD